MESLDYRKHYEVARLVKNQCIMGFQRPRKVTRIAKKSFRTFHNKVSLSGFPHFGCSFDY